MSRGLHFIGPYNTMQFKERLGPDRSDERIRGLMFFELVQVPPVPGEEPKRRKYARFIDLVQEDERPPVPEVEPVPDEKEAA